MRSWQDVGRRQATTVTGTVAHNGSKQYGWSAVLCAVLAILLWVGPYLLRPDLFYDDVAHHVFWLYQLADPALFPNDLTVAYFLTSAPWGYRGLYAALVPHVDALLAAKMVAAVLLAAALGLAWRIGRLSVPDHPGQGGLLGIVALVALLAWSQQKDLIPPIGFQRTFALPLLLLTLWALLAGRYIWLGVSWLAAALFYPVTLPVQGLTAGLVFLRQLVTERKLPEHWWFIVLAGTGALAIAAFGTPIPANVGPAFTFEQARQMVEFGPGGRLELFPSRAIANWFTGHRTGLGWSPGVLALIATAVLYVSFRAGARRIPFAAWSMALVGLALWSAMRLFPSLLMFGLYLPNRHSRWAIAAFGVVAGAVACAHWLRSGATLRARGGGWVAIAAPVAVAALLFPHAVTVARHPVDQDLERTYAFLATLPKDTLVAAHPDLADFVPVRARRSILASTEVSMAWMQNYYAQMKPRMEASLRAAYATRIEQVDAALAPYEVDVMLSGPGVWAEHATFVPFRELESVLQAQGAATGFVLQRPPPERVLFRSGDYYVIRVGACEAPACP